ncbi:MAG: hypothetical protein GYB32_01500 [Algicola sp.]|nr:hypothetical protein [Algicola sp.]
MSDKKHIDKLFKEQLKNFEVAPDDAVWERIEKELHKEDRKKRIIIPLWWKVAGVAAALVVMFTVGNALFNKSTDTVQPQVGDTKIKTDSNETIGKDKKDKATNQLLSKEATDDAVVENNQTESTDSNTSEKSFDTEALTNEASTNNPVTNTSEDSNKNINKNPSILKEKASTKEAVANTNSQKKETQNSLNKSQLPVNNTEKNKKNSVAVSKENQSKSTDDLRKDQSEIDKLLKDSKNGKSTQVTTANNSETEHQLKTIDSTKASQALKEKNAIEEAIADAEKSEDSIDKADIPMTRWSVAPNVAPVYFNTLGRGSSLDNQFIDNNKEGDVTMSYGIKGTYAISKKLRIRAGVHKVDMGYTTDNILVFNDANASVENGRLLQNIKLNDTMNNNAYVSANSVSFASGPNILSTKEQGSIDQRLGFIEVPVEIEYQLFNKKVGVNLIGGFSTLFLSDNEVYSVQNNGNRTLMGEATNIRDMSYSANFGIGVNYNFTRQLQFNLEPTFKYQINTFNNTAGDFQPFFIGVYTGLSFKF